MKLEEQVVSLELAKKLKKLGFKQEGLFSWSNCNIAYRYEDIACSYVQKLDKLTLIYEENIPEKQFFGSEDDELDADEKEVYSAYTPAELGEMLPAYFDSNHYLYIWKDDKDLWRIHYTEWGIVTNFVIEKDTEANARAKMLIYLKEKKLI